MPQSFWVHLFALALLLYVFAIFFLLFLWCTEWSLLFFCLGDPILRPYFPIWLEAVTVLCRLLYNNFPVTLCFLWLLLFLNPVSTIS
jgi:hypothetical protein